MALTPGGIKRMDQLAERATTKGLEGYERGEIRAMLLSRPDVAQQAKLEAALAAKPGSGAAPGDPAVPAPFTAGLKRAGQHGTGGSARNFSVRNEVRPQSPAPQPGTP